MEEIKKEEEQLTFDIPDNENIPCRTCIFGSHYYLDIYCAKYNIKPKEVYYQNQACPNYKSKVK